MLQLLSTLQPLSTPQPLSTLQPLTRYGARLGYGGADIYMCASEVPEIFERDLGAVLARVRAAARPWAVHLFSKAPLLATAP